MGLVSAFSALNVGKGYRQAPNQASPANAAAIKPTGA